MAFKTFLFDLDGVLVDTDEIQYKTTHDAIFELLHFDISTNTELENIFKSTITTIEKLDFLINYLSFDFSMIKIIYNRKKELADSYFSKLTIDMEKVELMKYLKGNHCNIAVVTNSNKNSAIIILKQIGIYDFIDLIVSNEDVLNTKPNPEPYLNAIEYFNVNKNECIIFEDSEVGIMSAKNTGCKYIHVKKHTDVNVNLITPFLI
jgi:HAD superfamily hydrolase (TIGR01509 family)